MDITQILALYNIKPFQPFVMHLADGKKIPVYRKEYFSRSPSGRRMVVYQLDDSVDFVETSNVVGLEISQS